MTDNQARIVFLVLYAASMFAVWWLVSTILSALPLSFVGTLYAALMVLGIVLVLKDRKQRRRGRAGAEIEQASTAALEGRWRLLSEGFADKK